MSIPYAVCDYESMGEEMLQLSRLQDALSMGFCPPNVTLGQVWLDGGLSHCLWDTLKAGLLALIMGLIGTLELRMYRRGGLGFDLSLLRPLPLLYLIQQGLTVALALLQLSRLALRLSAGAEGASVVLSDLILAGVWLFSAVLVYVERNFELPVPASAAAPRHGLPLLLFWATALAFDVLELVSVHGTHWPFLLAQSLDGWLLALYVIQCACELGLLLIGLRAPGLISSRQRNQYVYRPMAESPKYGSVEFASSSGGGGFLDSIERLRTGLKTGDLIDEFNNLPRQARDKSITLAKKRENEIRNRYWNILPYDDNVVTTRNGAVYVNASWVEIEHPGLDVIPRYIACQGPKPETTGEFWEMVWEQRIPLLLMLTEVEEKGLTKCSTYWPSPGTSTELSGGLHLSGVADRRLNRWTTEREFLLLRTGSDERLTVEQLHFHGWPDHGAPEETRRLLDFWRAVRERTPPSRFAAPEAPLLVHCSAGVGRTGVYILLESMIQLLDAEVPVDPIAIVRSLRQQRMAAVQTEEQLVYTLRCCLEYHDARMGSRRL